MDFIMWMWLGIFIVLLIFELATTGLTTIWFAAGALVSFIVAVCNGPLWLEIVLFFVISIAMLLLTRPIIKKLLKTGETRTNVESIVGEQVRIIEEVNNFNSTGVALVGAQEWTARAEADTDIIPIDSMAEVVGIKGVKLIVKKIEE